MLDNILEAILPEIPEDEKETPAGFAQVGHVGELLLFHVIRYDIDKVKHMSIYGNLICHTNI